jgi:hypothetical protein
MRAKVKQDELNVKLIQSMEKIENNMDKEIEMRRSRSHMSHYEKRREERSDDKQSFKKT